MSFDIFKDVVTFLLAIYAAVLSTFNFISSFNRDRRKIKLTMNTTAPTYGPEVGPPFVQINATNAGHRAVTITLLTLRMPDRKRLFPLGGSFLLGAPDISLPANLREGETATRSLSYEQVATSMLEGGYKRHTKITPICEDSLGTLYKGKPWKIDLHEWAKMR